MHLNSLPPIRVRIIVLIAMAQFVFATQLFGQAKGVPEKAQAWPALERDGVSAFLSGRTLWLRLDEDAIAKKRVVIPRLCAAIRSVQWKGRPKAELKIKPEQGEWSFTWAETPKNASVIRVVFDSKPLLPADLPIAVPAGDGSLMLHAYQAQTHGEKILFEPQWYKNTVGYWAVETDYATWDLKIDQPGTYSIAVLQGCGKGHGGSDAVITLSQGDDEKAKLPFKTIDTGHFQNFRWNHLGFITVSKAGQYEFRISAERIAKVALFDVRMIHLVRQASAPQ